MLEDNLPYKEILSRLGEHGQRLNKDNLSRWRKADHQDWRLQNLWAEVRRDYPEMADSPWELLFLELQPQFLNQITRRDPASIIRLLNLIPKLSPLAFALNPPKSQ